MRQMTLAQQAEFQRYWKKTRGEQFLDEMAAVMPWTERIVLIEPHYPKGEMGRKPVGLEIMLRVYFLQQWFALSDRGVEDALYESPVLRRCFIARKSAGTGETEMCQWSYRHVLHDPAMRQDLLKLLLCFGPLVFLKVSLPSHKHCIGIQPDVVGRAKFIRRRGLKKLDCSGRVPLGDLNARQNHGQIYPIHERVFGKTLGQVVGEYLRPGVVFCECQA